MGEYYGSPVSRNSAKKTCPVSENEYWEPYTTSYGENSIDEPAAQRRDITYCSRSPCPYQSRATSRERSRSAGPWNEAGCGNGVRLRVRPSREVGLRAPDDGRREFSIQRRSAEERSRSGESLDVSPRDDWELLVSEHSERPIYVRKSRGASDVNIVFEDGRGCRSRVRLRTSSGTTPPRAEDDQCCGRSDAKSSELFADASEEALDRASCNDFNSLRRRWSLWAVRQCSPRRRRSVTVTFDSCETTGTSLRGSEGSLSSESEAPCNPGRRSTVSIQWYREQFQPSGWEPRDSRDDLQVKPRTGRYDHWQILQAAGDEEDEEYCPRDADRDSGQDAKPSKQVSADAPCLDTESADTQGASKPFRGLKKKEEEPEGLPEEVEAEASYKEAFGSDQAATAIDEEQWEDPISCPEEEAKEGGQGTAAGASVAERITTADDAERRPQGDDVMTTTAVALFTIVLAIILFVVLSNWMCAQRSRGPSVNPF